MSYDCYAGKDIRAHIQVLGCGNYRDTQPCFMVNITTSSYMSSQPLIVDQMLFNPAEGLQRLLQEYRVKTNKLNFILLTRLNCSTVGGIPGLNFQMSSDGNKELNIRGPCGVKAFIREYSKFVIRKWPILKPKVVESNSANNAKYETFGFTHFLVVTLKHSNPLSCKSSKSYCHWCSLMQQDTDSDTDSGSETGSETGSDSDSSEASAASKQELGVTHENSILCLQDEEQSSLCYIVYISKTLQIDAAPQQYTMFLVVDCPTLNFIPSLIGSSHLQFSCKSHYPSFIVHLSPIQVIQNNRYQVWMNTLSSKFNARHILLHHSTSKHFNSIVHRASFKHYLYLSCVSDLLFHKVNRGMIHLSNSIDFTKQFANVIQGELLMRCQLLFEDKQRIVIDNASIPKPIQFEEIFEKAHLLLSDEDSNEIDIDIDLEDDAAPPTKKLRASDSANVNRTAPCLVFFGTGAAKPSKLRSCSSIYVMTEPASHRGVLLDCGEGTYEQFQLRFPVQAGELGLQLIANLQLVWISHAHLDHHGGLVKVLERHYALNRNSNSSTTTTRPLLVIAPTSIEKYLVVLYGAERSKELFEFLSCESISKSVDQSVYQRIYPVTRISSVAVQHCFDAHAVSLDLKFTGSQQGVRIVYSGDTRPCHDLAAISKSVKKAFQMPTVLIHEATFDNSMLQHAIRKKHSTIGEAQYISDYLQADMLILTHFSQRYPKLIKQDDSEAPGCLLASDMMQVPLMDLPQVAKQIPSVIRMIKLLESSVK